MFQLFKSRAFGDYISDTFQFIKLYGKHYFKNYFKFAFVALLLLMVAMSVFSIFYARVLTTSIGFETEETIDNNFITENAILMVVSIIALVIVMLYLAVLNYSYPVYYLRLIGEKPEEKPQLPSIRTLLKKDLGRLLLFGLLSAIVFSIIGLIGFGIAFILIFILIGLLVFLIIVPFFTTWYTLTFFYYSNDNLPFFEAMGKAFNTIFRNFWTIIGANLCMMIIVNVLSTAVIMIPYMLMMFGLIFGMSDMNNLENIETLDSSTPIIIAVIIAIMYCISTLVSLLLSHLMLIQVGLVYYSERENTEQHSLRQSIDEIGKYE